MTGAAGDAVRAPGLLVNLDVDDLERGVRFYTEVFGLAVGRRFREPWIELIGGPINLYLLQKPAGSQATAAAGTERGYRRHWTPVHLDFLVASIEETLARAVARGATVERPIADEPYGRIAMLADPFGHGLCVIEMNAAGYDAPGL